MFMKKRRHAELMAGLHGPGIIGAPPTPPQSDTSDQDSDGDLGICLENNWNCEKQEKYDRTSEYSDSILAKVRRSKEQDLMICFAAAHRFSQL